MTRDSKKSVQTEQTKAYSKPTLDRRAKLTDVAEGVPVLISGVLVEIG